MRGGRSAVRQVRSNGSISTARSFSGTPPPGTGKRSYNASPKPAVRGRPCPSPRAFVLREARDRSTWPTPACCGQALPGAPRRPTTAPSTPAARGWDSWREITTQRGLHVRRQIIEALSREHDWPGGQSDFPLGALGGEGLPGLEVELLGEVYRQQPDGLQPTVLMRRYRAHPRRLRVIARARASSAL